MSATSDLDRFVGEYIATAQDLGETLVGRDIAQEYLNVFGSDVLATLGEERIMDTIHDRIRKAMAQTRKGFVSALPGPRSRAEAESRLARAGRTWNAWLEWTGERHLRLTEMRKADLLAASAIRRKRGEHEIHLGILFERIADQMTDDQIVRDVWTPEDITREAVGLKLHMSVSWKDIIGEGLANEIEAAATAAD